MLSPEGETGPIEHQPRASEGDRITKERSETVDLGDNALRVDISDALSEKDKVKFTVHTKTTLKEFAKTEASVVREHDEFIWLHDAIVDNEDYAGFIIPPPPPRPDFDASREKLQKLGEGEATMTKEEFNKMKAELEAEYLATFKKTVAMHEVFLCRLAEHPVFRNDMNFRIFLEYTDELSVRGKNKKEKLGGFFRSITKSADEVLLSGQKDVDDFFEHEKNYLIEYHNHIREATAKSDRMTRLHKGTADALIQVATTMETMATMEKNSDLHKWLLKGAETLEKVRKLEARVAADEDLKLSGNVLRYYMRDTQAAKDLLYRRMRCLANYEAANKNLERARAKNKEVQKAEVDQQTACEKFEKITEKARQELTDLKGRRVSAMKKNLVDLAELEVKHAKAQLHMLKTSIAALKEGNL